QRPEKSVSHHANRGSPDVHLHQSEEDSVAGKKREYQPLARTPPAGNDDLYYLARYRASQSHGYGRAAVPSRGGGARPRRRTVGAVIKVVSTAMSSSMVNKEGWMMPACRPMLMTTSSIRPREFRSAPTLKVIRQGWPNRRAPIAAPTSFPPTAPMRISQNRATFSQDRTAMTACKPVEAKNTGRSRVRTMVPNGSGAPLAALAGRGAHTPNNSAPKAA